MLYTYTQTVHMFVYSIHIHTSQRVDDDMVKSNLMIAKIWGMELILLLKKSVLTIFLGHFPAAERNKTMG